MIELNGIVKHYGTSVALNGVSAALSAGRTHVLIGPSGCGKSTLLRTIIGLTTPDSGDVKFDGVPLHARPIAEVRRRVGYVIQEGGLFPHLTARDNAAIMPCYLRWAPQQTAARLKQLLELTRLPATILDRHPRQLSGGQRQRVSLMRALMLDPDVLLLDEPLGRLDPIVRADLQEDLRRIFRDLGKTVVLVTHDLDEAEYLADYVYLMRDGQIVQQGSIHDLIEKPADDFVGRFVRAQRRSA